MIPFAEDPQEADRIAVGILTHQIDPASILDRVAQGIASLDPWRPPPREPGLLLCAITATQPDTITPDIGEAINAVLEWSNLTEAWQPALDEIFRLLPMLVATPAVTILPKLADRILSTPEIHHRWSHRASALLAEINLWQPEILDLDTALSIAVHAPEDERGQLFHDLVEPIALADPSMLSATQFERACAVPLEPLDARYLANAIASHPQTCPEIRKIAAALTETWFPLRATWRRLTTDCGLRVLCVQNIADAQGDEIVRLNTLLQALLDDHPETRIVLVTDRAYLWSHGRIETVSFDDVQRIERALSEQPDVLIEFFERDVHFLNHDPALADRVAALREAGSLALDVRASKGWDRFIFDTVQLGGFEWAQALGLNRSRIESVYDPASRLIAELGLPLRMGETAPSRPVLAAGPWSAADEAWQHAVRDNRDNRPIALVNPFGGAKAIKGFVARKLDDLARLLTSLVDEGYFAVICLTGTQWGSSEIAAQTLALLPEDYRQHISVGPDPTGRHGRVALDDDRCVTGPYASAVMRQMLTFIAKADLIVTVEGWMGHAAFSLGKPFRILSLPASHDARWLPWGRSNMQQRWRFAGNSRLDTPALPELPRKAAWLQTFHRARGPEWLPILETSLQSEDPDIRRAAAQALGQTGTNAARPLLERSLSDSAHRVRGVAAETLTTHFRNGASEPRLHSFRMFAEDPPNWHGLYEMGEPAIPALNAALYDDDPATRRVAAAMLAEFALVADDKRQQEGWDQ